MGLLIHDLDKKFNQVADNVYKRHFEVDGKLEEEYSVERRKRMYEDILHNLSFLQTAVKLNDEKIFKDYAIWLFELMVHLMPDLSHTRVREHMITHYELLLEELKHLLESDDLEKVEHCISEAITLTKSHGIKDTRSDFEDGDFGVIRKTYLEYLLKGQSKEAIAYILEVADMNIKLEDIYVDVLEKVMTEIGKLWHRRKLTVDQEHYMTSITQLVISQFYNRIFNSTRKGLKLLACSVGSELHEMGARMVADLFEYSGWDTYYLGAAVPINNLLESIATNKPDLVALSVTMPQHLVVCKDIVYEISNKFPNLKIAVGGRAFSTTDNLWKQWPVDISTSNAKQLIEWAEKEFS